MKHLLHVFFEAHHHNEPVFKLFERFAEFGQMTSNYLYFDRGNFFPEKEYVPNDKAFYFCANADFLPWLRKEHLNYDLIVFHGLFNSTLWNFLATETAVAEHSAWVVFGGEIYEGLDGATPERLAFMQQTSSNLKHILTFTAAEADIIRAQLSRRESIQRYIYIQDWDLPAHGNENLSRQLPSELETFCRSAPIALLGNSGTAANFHIEMLNALANADYEGAMIIPLAYGASAEYREKIQMHARTLFPSHKLCFLTQSIESDLYRVVLSRVNYYFMPHIRQQAGQHWLAALASGIPIFGHEDGANYQHFTDMGFQVGNVFAPQFCPAKLASFANNKNLYQQQFNFNKVYELWSDGLGVE